MAARTIVEADLSLRYTLSVAWRQWNQEIFVTLHHKMSRNVPDCHFQVFIFSESKFNAFYSGENHIQIRGIVAGLHVFEYGGTTFGTFGKTWFNVEDFYVKTKGWG